MRTAALTAMVVSALTLTGSVAAATPSRGVTGTIIGQTTVGGKDIVVREITLDHDGSTGWHWHDGTLYAYVKQGTLTHTNSDCTTQDVYPAGSAFLEPAGDDHVHIGRNLGNTPVILEVVYVLPHGKPLSEDAPNPGCDFQ